MKLNGIIRPRPKIQSEIVKPATGLKNTILKARFPISDFVLNNAIAFNAANSMFDPNPQRSMPLVDALVQVRQRLAFGFLFGLQDSHISQCEALKTAVLT